MNDFLKEPWAFILVFAIAANVLWLIVWISMWSKDRFKNSLGGGFPILLSIGILNIPFGVLFLAGAILGTAVLSVFWVGASLTNSFENERKAISAFLNPSQEEKTEEGGAEEAEAEKPAAKKTRAKKKST
jgi:hypothetical protein